MYTPQHLIISGAKGVGKTTLITKICFELEKKKVFVEGFISPKVETKYESGYDILSLTNAEERHKLARSQDDNYYPKTENYLQKGDNLIFIDNLERVSMPLLKSVISQPNGRIVALDEIGWMACLSEPLKKSMFKIVESKDCSLLATIPEPNQKLDVVHILKRHPNCKVFKVTQKNRDRMLPQILKWWWFLNGAKTKLGLPEEKVARSYNRG